MYDEGYSRKASRALNLTSTFLFQLNDLFPYKIAIVSQRRIDSKPIECSSFIKVVSNKANKHIYSKRFKRRTYHCGI